MSSPFRMPRNSTSPSEPPIIDEAADEAAIEAEIEAAMEPATRAADEIISGAADHQQHPNPHSGLLESHIFPIIYTKYHFEDIKFGYLQFTKEMVEKHQKMGIKLNEGDIPLCWLIQVRREYPDGHPLRRILMEQMDRYDIRLFWERHSNNDNKDKKALKSLNKKVEELNKQVKCLNEEVARLNKMSAERTEDGNSSDASDHLPRTKKYEPKLEQPQKRKRTGSAGGDRNENRGHQPSLVREDDLRTDKRRYQSGRLAPSGLPLYPRDHDNDNQMRGSE